MKYENRLVIIKQFLGFGDPPSHQELDAFRRESDLLKKLQHACLPRGYEYFKWNGGYYSAIEYIEGDTLEACAAGIRLEPSVVLEWAVTICDLLKYLHTQDPPIILRDVKPANFVLSKWHNKPVLVDLSISRYYKVGQSKDTALLGTLGFAPPEQHGKAQTDPRADLFSLGVTIHVLLTLYDVTQTHGIPTYSSVKLCGF